MQDLRRQDSCPRVDLSVQDRDVIALGRPYCPINCVIWWRCDAKPHDPIAAVWRMLRDVSIRFSCPPSGHSRVRKLLSYFLREKEHRHEVEWRTQPVERVMEELSLLPVPMSSPVRVVLCEGDDGFYVLCAFHHALIDGGGIVRSSTAVPPPLSDPDGRPARHPARYLTIPEGLASTTRQRFAPVQRSGRPRTVRVASWRDRTVATYEVPTGQWQRLARALSVGQATTLLSAAAIAGQLHDSARCPHRIILQVPVDLRNTRKARQLRLVERTGNLNGVFTFEWKCWLSLAENAEEVKSAFRRADRSQMVNQWMARDHKSRVRTSLERLVHKIHHPFGPALTPSGRLTDCHVICSVLPRIPMPEFGVPCTEGGGLVPVCKGTPWSICWLANMRSASLTIASASRREPADSFVSMMDRLVDSVVEDLRL